MTTTLSAAHCRWGVRSRRSLVLLLLAVLCWMLLSPPLVSAFAGLGNYISEKVLGNGTNEALHLGDGVNELTVLGSGPVISTGAAISSSSGGVISAVLQGSISNLNGMPRADTWFVWGYSPLTMTNITAVSTVTSTGEQTATINPEAGKTVYYQFCSSTDGTSIGNIYSFLAGGAHGASYWFMNTLLPILIAAAILVFVLLATGNTFLAFAGAVIGLMAFYIIKAIVEIL